MSIISKCEDSGASAGCTAKFVKSDASPSVTNIYMIMFKAMGYVNSIILLLWHISEDRDILTTSANYR